VKIITIALFSFVLSSCATNYDVVNNELPTLIYPDENFSCKDKVEFYKYEIDVYNEYKDSLK